MRPLLGGGGYVIAGSATRRRGSVEGILGGQMRRIGSEGVTVTLGLRLGLEVDGKGGGARQGRERGIEVGWNRGLMQSREGSHARGSVRAARRWPPPCRRSVSRVAQMCPGSLVKSLATFGSLPRIGKCIEARVAGFAVGLKVTRTGPRLVAC